MQKQTTLQSQYIWGVFPEHNNIMFEHTFTCCCCFFFFFMNPSWVNFYYVKPDLLIKLFEIELSGHITVLGAIALTVYKETSQQVINLPPELSIRKESDLPSYVLIWQMNCLSLSLRFRLAISELPYFGTYVYYRPSFEAVVWTKEIKTPCNVIILSGFMHHLKCSPDFRRCIYAPYAHATPFLASLRLPALSRPRFGVNGLGMSLATILESGMVTGVVNLF